MIVDVNSNIIQAWFRSDGPIIRDEVNDIAIGVPYTDEQKRNRARIKELKEMLNKTDHKCYQWSEGWISDEDYEEIKLQRQAWREEIRALEFDEPTLTPEQIKEIEDKIINGGLTNG